MYVPNRILKKASKTGGKSWLWNLYINTASWRVMISDSFTIFRSLNKGLECSVKLEKVITLIAFFCTLDKGCKVDWYALPKAITQ